MSLCASPPNPSALRRNTAAVPAPPSVRTWRELLVVTAVLVLAAGWAGSTLSCFVDGHCVAVSTPVNPLGALNSLDTDPQDVLGLLVLAVSAIPYAVVLGWLTAGHRLLVRGLLAVCCHGLVTIALGSTGTAMSPSRLGLSLAMASVVALVVVAAAGDRHD